jgi:carboxypeptidase Taq
MNHHTPYQQLETIFARIKKLEQIASMLYWDNATNLPAGSMDARISHLSELKTLVHETYLAPKTLDLLNNVNTKELTLEQLANFKLMQKNHLEATIIDNDLANALIKATALSEISWRAARKDNDFKSYAPLLQEVVKLVKEKAACKAQKLGILPYEALGDEYEPGFSQTQTDKIFTRLKAFLQDFIPEVLAHQQKFPAKPLGKVQVSKEKQMLLAKEVMSMMGFDFTKGRLDLSEHPFCGGFSADCRLTTHFKEENFLPGLMGVIHESGHGLYEQHLPQEWLFQPLGRSTGMAMHESQSLFMEMQICRSREFLTFIIPYIHKFYAQSIPNLEPENFYRLINQVAPSLIRINADEVTYPLHVILRYELEKQMLSGELLVKDLPHAFNQAMQQYLGITPINDTMGCLQDIHWPSGYFGYFPSYSLGAMMGAQFQNDLSKKIPNHMSHIAKGDFSICVNYLSTNIHQMGSLYSSQQLVQKISGKDLDVSIYEQYLKKRFIEDYR